MIGRTVSHYKILETIGEGGMGVVYEAEDTKLKRAVALKFLPPELGRDVEAKERLVHEAQTASALDHPNICTIFEIDETGDGQLFIAMPRYQGETLKERIGRGRLDLEDCADILIQAAQGLERAHERGIVHRDIKPQNLFLTDDKSLKIMDFGLAMSPGRGQLADGDGVPGTVAYMSPEQARGEEVDHRTDIWSLGVVLYEAATGRLPFEGDYEQAILYSILNQDPEPVGNLRSDVPRVVERILERTMAKGAEDRYPDVTQLLDDLVKLKGEIQSKTQAAPEVDVPTKPSIAVLPFSNLSADPKQEYFCDGMAEEIINALAHVESLRVVARTSAFAFREKREDIREIGNRLSVENLLDGSVRKAGDRLRITVQLVSVEDGYQLWSERYDRDIGELCCPEDIFSIQDDIAQAVVDNLKVKLLKEEKAELVRPHTQDLQAYDLYLRGIYAWNKRTEDGLRTSLEFFQQAIDRDPSYALAYVGMANSYLVLAGHAIFPPREGFAKAKAAAERALEIDPTCAEAYGSLATTTWEDDFDWWSAEKAFERAIALRPGFATSHYMYSYFLAALGKDDKALAEIRRAQELDPLSLIINAVAGWVLYWAGRYDEAIEQYRRVLEMSPDFAVGRCWLGMAWVRKGMYQEAISELQQAIRLSSERPIYRARLAHAYAVAGKEAEARTILDELNELAEQRYIPPFSRALICAGLGMIDEAFDWLDKSVEDKYYEVLYLKRDPSFDSLRSDPRFAELLRKMGVDG